MPATSRGKHQNEYVLGVDGCRAGWVAVHQPLGDALPSVSIWSTFVGLRNAHQQAAMIIVDMPIGFPNQGRRACEAMARALLKPKRHASIFPTPARPMLSFETYDQANRWGKAQGPGGGLPKQTWMIIPKIRELDMLLTPDDQHHIGEGHPEVAFCRLNKNVPCDHSKKTAILQQNGFIHAEKLSARAKEAVGANGVSQDDVYDACSLALTAQDRLHGLAHHLTDGSRDDRGLLMEIWG